MDRNEFLNLWKRYKNLVNELNVDGVELLNSLFYLECKKILIAKGNGCVKIHLLLPIVIGVQECLPDPQKLVFYALQFTWTVSSKTDIQYTKRKITKNLQGGLESGKPDNVVKISNNEAIAFYDNQHESRTDYHICIAERSQVTLAYSGAFKRNSPKSAPNTAKRMVFCRKWFDLLQCEAAKEEFLIQEQNKIENWTSAYSGDKQTPRHIGWCENTIHHRSKEQYGHYSTHFLHHYGYGSSQTMAYGNYIQTTDNSVQKQLTDPFIAIDPSISIPLFAYSLFSIIKFFITRYPARISGKEPYISVKRKQKHLIFADVKGSKRKEAAFALCGAFSAYRRDGDLITQAESGTKLRSLYDSRIHDGVVILEGTYHDGTKLLDGDLLRDACCLLLNADFPHMDNEITVIAERVPNDKVLNNVADSVAYLIRVFVKNLYVQYVDYERDYATRYVREIYIDFLESINSSKNIERFGKYQDVEIIEKEFGEIHDLDWAAALDVKQVLLARYNCYYKDYGMGIWKAELLNDKDEFEEKSKKKYEKMKREQAERFLHFAEADSKFGNCSTKDVKYRYLYRAMHLFCLLYSGIDKSYSEWLDKKTLEVLRDMIDAESNAVDLSDTFIAYLSHEIQLGHIIANRSSYEATVTGWYDAPKGMIYLPYGSFYEQWRRSGKFRTEKGGAKRDLLRELHKKGILLIQESQIKGNSVKYWARITVTPAGTGKQPQEKVIKLCVDSLPLTKKAVSQLGKLADIHVQRRSKSIEKE